MKPGVIKVVSQIAAHCLYCKNWAAFVTTGTRFGGFKVHGRTLLGSLYWSF